MKSIKQILAIKGNQVFTTTPDTLIVDAVKEMAKKKVGALIVMLNDEIKGVITEQDFSRRVILADLDTANTYVKDVMTFPVEVISPQQSINDGMLVMTEKRIRHLPVMHENKLIGLISIGDLVKEVISEHESTIEHLEQYIHS